MQLELIARHGIFSAADTLRAGLDRHALTRLVRDGTCTRLTRGWYAVTPVPLDALERHRLTARALGLDYRSSAGLSHHTCLAAVGAATYAVDLSTVHLTRAGPTTGRSARSSAGLSARRPGLALHRPMSGLTVPAAVSGPGLWERPWHVPVAWAVVQTGLVSGAVSALVAADSALHRGLVTGPQLSGAIARFARHAGVAAVRAALVHTDARHESPGETRLAQAARLLGFTVVPQFEVVAEGRRFRADFRVEGTKVLLEFDGAVKYDAGRQVLMAEKQREDALRREGWIIVRVLWAELDQPELLRQRILKAIGASQAR